MNLKLLSESQQTWGGFSANVSSITSAPQTSHYDMLAQWAPQVGTNDDTSIALSWDETGDPPLSNVVVLSASMNSGRYPFDVTISPTWLSGTKALLAESFANLEWDWDGYGAPPTDARAVQTAEALLEWFAIADVPRPDVFPMSDGGVRIEWHVFGLDAEIDVAPSGNPVDVYYRDLQAAEEWERSLGPSGQELRAVRRRLLKRHA